MKDNEKEEKDRTSPKEKASKASIIVAVIALAGVIFTGLINMKIQKSKEEHEKYLQVMENAYEQKFDMSEEIITRAGIEYIKYEISTNPAVNGFHVIPYVYIEIEMPGERKCVPVMGQFLQEEYVAGQDGKCILYRENTKEDLLEKLEELGCEVWMECIVAIEYVVEGKPEVRVCELRTGQFEDVKEDKVITVIEAWEKLDYAKIDMTSWPVGSERQLEEMLKDIGY